MKFVLKFKNNPSNPSLSPTPTTNGNPSEGNKDTKDYDNMPRQNLNPPPQQTHHPISLSELGLLSDYSSLSEFEVEIIKSHSHKEILIKGLSTGQEQGSSSNLKKSTFSKSSKSNLSVNLSNATKSNNLTNLSNETHFNHGKSNNLTNPSTLPKLKKKKLYKKIYSIPPAAENFSNYIPSLGSSGSSIVANVGSTIGSNAVTNSGSTVKSNNGSNSYQAPNFKPITIPTVGVLTTRPLTPISSTVDIQTQNVNDNSASTGVVDRVFRAVPRITGNPFNTNLDLGIGSFNVNNTGRSIAYGFDDDNGPISTFKEMDPGSTISADFTSTIIKPTISNLTTMHTVSNPIKTAVSNPIVQPTVADTTTEPSTINITNPNSITTEPSTINIIKPTATATSTTNSKPPITKEISPPKPWFKPLPIVALPKQAKVPVSNIVLGGKEKSKGNSGLKPFKVGKFGTSPVKKKSITSPIKMNSKSVELIPTQSKPKSIDLPKPHPKSIDLPKPDAKPVTLSVDQSNSNSNTQSSVNPTTIPSPPTYTIPPDTDTISIQDHLKILNETKLYYESLLTSYPLLNLRNPPDIISSPASKPYKVGDTILKWKNCYPSGNFNVGIQTGVGPSGAVIRLFATRDIKQGEHFKILGNKSL